MSRLETSNKMAEVTLKLWTTTNTKKKFMSNLFHENFQAYSSPIDPNLTKSTIINLNFYFNLTLKMRSP